MRGELTSEIKVSLIPIFNELAFDLVELTVKKNHRTVMLDILADKQNGGITVDECTLLNKQVVQLLEQRQICGEDFVVQVSSPGLDRPLKTSKDFLRVVGRNVRVHLKEPVENKMEHHGEVREVKDDYVVLITKGKHISLLFANIIKAVQLA